MSKISTDPDLLTVVGTKKIFKKSVSETQCQTVLLAYKGYTAFYTYITGKILSPRHFLRDLS